MAGNSESTPFLAEHIDDSENHDNPKILTPNAHFKRPIKIVKIVLAILSLSAVGLLIAAFAVIQSSQNMNYLWQAKSTISELGTCVRPPHNIQENH